MFNLTQFLVSLLVLNNGHTKVIAIDNAPSGVPLISKLGGRWEMEATWELKVVMTVDDWNEPLYTWYDLLVL